MTTAFHRVPCPNCGSLRSPNLSLPCELCNSRKIPILGYTYGVEIPYLRVLLFGLIFICLIAFVAGAIFIYIKTFWLQSALIVMPYSFLNISLFWVSQ